MKVIAYYLGQYSPLEQNDQVWGEGFTEWHNVARARSLFPGHAQPLLPGRFGFYNLQCDDVLHAQLAYARETGVDAFCHWHYWFAGKRVLHAPLDRMLSLPDYGIKMMLGWANESWTGIWHGLSDKVLFEQSYDSRELDEHARLIASYIQSERYLKVGNASPFLIYKPRLIPDARDYLEQLRNRVRKYGGEDLYIIGSWGPGQRELIQCPEDYGLDAVVANNVGPSFRYQLARVGYQGFWKCARYLGIGPEIRHYRSTSQTLMAAHATVQGTVHATVVTGWDNTPRSGRRGLVLRGYNAESLTEACIQARTLEQENPQPLLFIKSWNEWAEGNVLEPRFKETWSAGDIIRSELGAYKV